MHKLNVVDVNANELNHGECFIADHFNRIFTVDINSLRTPTRFLGPIDHFMSLDGSGNAYVLDGVRANAKVFVYAGDDMDTPVLTHDSYRGIVSTDALINALAPTINKVADERMLLSICAFEMHNLQRYMIAEYFASIYGDVNAEEFYGILISKTIHELNAGLPEPLESLNFDYDLELTTI